MLSSKTSIDNTGINVVMSRDDAVASLCGRIDIDSSPAIREELLTVLQTRYPSVVIDLSAVTHIDSSGVATLIEALRMARGHTTELTLQGLEGRLLRSFEVTGILSLFNRERPNMSEPGSKAV